MNCVEVVRLLMVVADLSTIQCTLSNTIDFRAHNFNASNASILEYARRRHSTFVECRRPEKANHYSVSTVHFRLAFNWPPTHRLANNLVWIAESC